MTLKNTEDGCECHGDLDKSVSVIIDGPSEMKPGETADFTLTITGGPLLNGGLNASVTAGKFTEGAGTKVMKGELTHFEPKLPKDGKIFFTFKYTAPDKAGEVTMFANGLSGNNNETKRGDHWNYAENKIIDVIAGK